MTIEGSEFTLWKKLIPQETQPSLPTQHVFLQTTSTLATEWYWKGDLVYYQPSNPCQSIEIFIQDMFGVISKVHKQCAEYPFNGLLSSPSSITVPSYGSSNCQCGSSDCQQESSDQASYFHFVQTVFFRMLTCSCQVAALNKAENGHLQLYLLLFWKMRSKARSVKRASCIYL